MTGNPSSFVQSGDLSAYAKESSVSGKLDASASSLFAPSGDYAFNSSLSSYIAYSAVAGDSGQMWTTPNGSGSANGTLPSALSAFDEFIVAYSIQNPSYTRQYQTFNGTANDVCLNGLMTDPGASPWGFYMAEARFSSNATNWVVVNNTGSCNWWMATRCGQTNGWTADSYGARKLNGVYEIIGVKYQ